MGVINEGGSIVVTGGAGFIGSCIVAKLNEMGIDEIYIVDNVNTSEKWMNLRNKKYIRYYHKDEFLEELPKLTGIKAIIHMGACSATTEQDFDYLYKNNYLYTIALWNYCAEKQISFLYASSAATYGGGELGFDDKMDIKGLMPLNRYGYSKQIFDLWAEKQENRPAQVVGMKFFNVYGPNEYAKGRMASMIYHGYRQVMEKNSIGLFKSYKEGFEDGGQLRDFVYVKDICDVIYFFLEHPQVDGLFNLGTGHAESFKTLAESVFIALDRKPNIQYIEMPEDLRGKYQYFTEAKMDKLREAGYTKEFYDLRSGAIDYVQNYLHQDFKVW
ncbi:MAG: ADP-glyceromanno-heptose 6-epimerase [Lachnospiraceae bacterium]